MELRVGVPVISGVKITELLVPDGVMTVTLCGRSEAFGLIAKIAFNVVEFVPLTPLTVISVPASTVVCPGAKSVPVRVTSTLAPMAPWSGLIEVSVGGKGDHGN